MPGITRISAPEVPQFVEHKMAGPLQKYLNDLSGFLQREFRRRPETQQAQASVYLSAPNGDVYALSVSNAGAAVFTLVKNG
jgi:hypothetical protein